MKYKAYATLAVLLCFLGVGWSQIPTPKPEPPQPTGYWKDIPEVSLPKTGREAPLPKKFRLLEMDVAGMKALLESARDQALAGRDQPTVLTVPMPDGSYRDFSVRYDPVMHPELAAKFPEIMSFSGSSATGEQGTTLHYAFSHLGFHAFVYPLEGDAAFIEPIQKFNAQHYISFYEREMPPEYFHFECGVGQAARTIKSEGVILADSPGDCQLRTYDLAMAAVAEFTASNIGPGDPTGVTTTLALFANALVTINAVYLREFTIRLQLIANNNLIIFTNVLTDGYTDGGNLNTVANENPGIIDGVIGSANYDIGHVIGGGGGGVSFGIGIVCDNGNKGRAASSFPAAGLLMHEFGHQFGTNHTFNDMVNGNCALPGQFNASTAYEPGSGSTIMSYQGGCSPADVPLPGGLYFNTISLQHVGNYVTTGNGNTCPTTTPLTNNAPTVSAAPVASYTIPISTPFRLQATANDVDGNPLSYCWEQYNNDAIPHPPATTATNGPVFRSFPPTPSPTRYFPNLPDLLAGNPTPWEVLPSVSRTLNFNVTVRDNAPGGGCTDEDGVVVFVSNTGGPFTVNNPVSGPQPNCLLAGENATITWNVANTTAAPINCANVDIWLSLDGGLTFTILLAGSTPNDGSQSVAVPASAITTEGRIMVMAVNNIFFNINSSDIRIDCPMNRIVTDNPASGVYKVRGRLETFGNVVVLPGTTARFFAGQEIALKPGFRAQAGSDFIARIKPCDPCVPGSPQDLASEHENPRVYFYDTFSSNRTSVKDGSSLNALAFPNPFDQNFTIAFELPAAGKVDIQLFNLRGQSVQRVYQNDNMEAGMHQVPVSAAQLKDGVYICTIIANDKREQVKLVKVQ